MPSRLAQREYIRDTHKTDVPSLPLLAIRGYLCFRCLLHTDELIKCAGCERAAYCSIECQTQDWHVAHKMHCKPLQAVNEIERRDSPVEQSWDDYTSALHRNAQVAKSQTSQEQSGDMVQAVIGQPYCSVCRKSHSQTTHQAPLKACETCRLIFTCSDCTSKHTPAECQHYCLLGEVEQYKLQRFDDEGTITAIETTALPKTVTEQRPLAESSGWLDYYRWVSGKVDGDNGITTDFAFSTDASSADYDLNKQRWLHLLLATDSMTVPLSAIAALEDSIPDIATKTTLEIHLVGAAGKEFRNLKLFEELLHLLPALQHLSVVLIGPESPGASAGQTGDLNQSIEMACCEPCTASGRRRTVTSFQGGYHEYAARPAYAKPDLAILFHSGRSQANVEGWKPTTKLLVDSGTLTLCTTYTAREAQEEVAELEGLGARFVRDVEVNRWRGMVPLPELLEGPEHGAYYNNFYRYVFQGRGEFV